MNKYIICTAAALIGMSASGPALAEFKHLEVTIGSTKDITGLPDIFREGNDPCHFREIESARVLRGSRLGTFGIVDTSGAIPYVAMIGHDACIGRTISYRKIVFDSDGIAGVENLTVRVKYDDHTSKDIDLKVIVHLEED